MLLFTHRNCEIVSLDLATVAIFGDNSIKQDQKMSRKQ